MTDNPRISVDDLTDDQIEQILNSRLFQKGRAYRRLADGVAILEDEDEIFESMVTSITKQHSKVRSESSTREFFKLFRQEVETFTEPLIAEDSEVDAEELEELYVDEDGDGDSS